jgi:hypothetical protein
LRVTIPDEARISSSIDLIWFRVYIRWVFNALTTGMFRVSRRFSLTINVLDGKIFYPGIQVQNSSASRIQ